MGKPSYTPPLNAWIPAPSAEIAYCSKGCGSVVELTPDAIGRLRERCPKCDGVAKRPVVRPGEVRRTQTIELGQPTGTRGLIALPAGVYRLPPIEPGQLRCQYCAHAVEGRARVCKRCVSERRTAAAAARPKAEKPARICPECKVNPILRRRSGKFGRPPVRCDACDQRRRSQSRIPCACGNPKPRGRKKCDACAAARTVRRCRRCGGTEQLGRFKQFCDKCRPLSDVEAILPRAYQEKACQRCKRPFIPTGSRQIFCRQPECLAS